MTKVALITGITGMDGHYLTKLLLEKGYTVHGLIRRSSSINTRRLDPFYKDLHEKDVRMFLHYGDLSDANCIERLVRKVQPNEVYNLAAMSHVKVSFEIPEYTADIDALGVLRVLEACRSIPNVKFYQAGTSELYGGVYDKPQNEDTPFNPRSPYAAAKLYGYWITKNYRESYGMFCCNGILFNHSSVPSYTPVIFKIRNKVDIKPIDEVIRYHSGSNIVNENFEKYQEGRVSTDLAIWDNNRWERVTYASGYPNSIKGDKPRYIISNKSAYMTTQDHVVIMRDGSEKKNEDVRLGDEVSLVEFPNIIPTGNVSTSEAEFLGLMARVGDVTIELKNGLYCFANKDPKYLSKAIDLWSEVGIQYNKPTYTSSYTSNSGVAGVIFRGFPSWMQLYNIYTDDRKKRVPVQILNAAKEVQLAFLCGYTQDGAIMNPCIYKIKTDSAVLAQGLLYLLSNSTKQDHNINIETTGPNSDIYYSLNIFSDSSLNKSNETVKKIIEFPGYDGWFYDLTTESGKFNCGVGRGRIHNSPLRGETFVEQKIVKAAVAIKHGKQECLYLGNIYTKRDIGHSADFTYGMWLMLQQDEPDDYVLATGESVMIKDIVDKVFDQLDMDLEWRGEGKEEIGIVDSLTVIRIDPKYYRPSEVDHLLGDSSKAREKLGWEPKYDLDMILLEMIDAENEMYEKV